MPDTRPVEQPEDGRVGVTVDGRAVRVPKGTLVLDAATQAGVHIPVYCAHPKMDPVAVCRMCLVKLSTSPKLQPACATVVSDGMAVETRAPEVVKEQEGVLEFLLLNHPLDCPVCDRGGECDLQDFTQRYGPPTSRFPITEKVHFNKALRLSDRIELDQERCILCWRCTRYYEEITGEKELVLQQRGVHTLVATFNGQPLTSEFQGNLPEVCPVGALTHVRYRFVSRPWDLQRTASICPECSYGCNLNVDSRDFEIKRFASRDNPLVDDMWLCDRGRYSFPRWNSTDRVRRPLVREARGGVPVAVTLAGAVAAAARQLAAVREERGPGAIAVLGSPESTNEELWLLRRLAREVLGTPHLDHQLERFAGLAPAEHDLGIAETEECRAVVVLGEEPEHRAPVLRLRLFKAETKRGVRVHRLPAGTAPAQAVEAVGTGPGLVGVIADETARAGAAEIAAALAAAGATVKRLTVTRGPNGRGAKDLGVTPGLDAGYRAAAEGMSGREILEAAAAGRVGALVMLNGAALAVDGDDRDLLERALASVAVLVAVESRPGPVAQSATVLIPGHSLMEKLGTITSCEGRVQRVRAALPPATATATETGVLSMLAGALGSTGWPSDPIAVHREIVTAVPAYAQAGNGGRALFRGAPA